MNETPTTTNAVGATSPTLRTKIVSYSYPTSTNAKRFGFYRSGCYTVGVMNGHQPARNELGFATSEEAFAHAGRLPIPFNRYSLLPAPAFQS